MFYTLHHEILEPEDGLTENSPGNDHTNRIRRPPIRLLVTLAVELAIIASAVTPALAQIEGSAGEEADSFELEADETDPGFQPAQSADRVAQVNLNRNRLPRSRRFTVSAGAQYTFDIGRWGSLAPRVDVYYRDEIAFRQYGDSKDVTPAYTRTDVRIIWSSITEQFWGEIFARKLENESTKTNQEVLGSIYRVHTIDQPRSVGFRVGYSY